MTDDAAPLLRQLNSQLESLARPHRPSPAGAGLSPFPAFVGRVFGDPTVPSLPGKFYSVHRVDLFGDEVEGGVATRTVDTSSSERVYVLGPGRAFEGDDLICRFVAHRWVATRGTRAGGGPMVSLPDCSCAPIPATLTMTSLDPTCNSGMFRSATLQYGDTPAELAALGLGDQCFLSTEGFADTATGDVFFYHFYCDSGVFALTRVYADSIFGSPFREAELYRWPVAAAGNSCSPLLLTEGTPFLGSDLSCHVIISE